jgi:IBR domain, a half RING-finger domain
MDLESCPTASSQQQGHSSDPGSSTSRPSRLFGRNCRTWYRDELVEVLDFFQVVYSQAVQKAELFDLLCDKVVRDRGVDECAIPAPLLLRFIRDDDVAVSQPLIGIKPKEDDGESESEGNRRTDIFQSSLKRKHEDMMAPRSATLPDYWPQFPGRDCEVCAAPLIRTVNTPWRRITGECAHRSTICLSCLQQHIHNQLEMNTPIAIPCVMCKATLAPEDVKAWMAPEFFERYQRISVQQAFHKGLSFRWCFRRGFQNGFLCDPVNDSYATCDACGEMTCLSCNVAYHEGASCVEALQARRARAKKKMLAERKAERKSRAKVRRISVKCPGKNCGVRIEKKDGCDHMICK